MSETVQTADFVAPDEVRVFAREQGLEERLPAVLETARRAFPGADVRVYLEEDAEIKNDWHIIIDVKAPYLTVDQAMEARNAYYDGLYAVCPAPLICIFRLWLELA